MAYNQEIGYTYCYCTMNSVVHVHYPTLSAIDAMIGCHLATAAAVAAQPSKERG